MPPAPIACTLPVTDMLRDNSALYVTFKPCNGAARPVRLPNPGPSTCPCSLARGARRSCPLLRCGVHQHRLHSHFPGAPRLLRRFQPSTAQHPPVFTALVEPALCAASPHELVRVPQPAEPHCRTVPPPHPSHPPTSHPHLPTLTPNILPQPHPLQAHLPSHRLQQWVCFWRVTGAEGLAMTALGLRVSPWDQRGV